MKKILIFSGDYPTPDNPAYAFIKPVACEMADLGLECTVVCPQSLTNSLIRHKKRRPEQWFDETENHNRVCILQPWTISFSDRGKTLNNFFSKAAIRRARKKYRLEPDVVYGHFWDNAVLAHETFGDKPLIAVSGESTIRVRNNWDEASISAMKENLTGLIAVSTKNLNESEQCGLWDPNVAHIVLPNAVNPQEFYQMSTADARKKLGLSQEQTIACFVGAFSDGKGVHRVIEAAKGIDGLKLILIGSGDQSIKPDEQILFAGRLPHEQIVTYLNAADFFVLPTKAEGCCNAIVEALACGLPVVSSDCPFNDDILNENNSIRIAPTDVPALHEAMQKLTDDLSLRQKLARGAEQSGAELKITTRVKKIVEFIQQVVLK